MLAGDDIDDDPLSSVLGHSITYRIAVGQVIAVQGGEGENVSFPMSVVAARVLRK
jgi:hypothetical protein